MTSDPIISEADLASDPAGENPHRLTPAGILLWRSGSSVQLEVGTHRLVIEGVSGPAVRDLLADGPLSTKDTVAVGHARQVPACPSVKRLRTQLGERGYLWPADEDFAPPVPRLSAELTAMSARLGQDAADILAARAARSVVIHGSGRAASMMASLLAAAGIGRVHVVDRQPARLVHAIPGGVRPCDEGIPLTDAAAAAMSAAAPEVDSNPPPLDQAPDLVVLAIDEPVDSELRDGLHGRQLTHLPVSLSPSGGVAGPLVLPGVSSCLACADLHRRDRDEAWPALAAQLTMPPRHPRSGEVAVSAAICGIAAGQALAYLDGEQPMTLEGTLELHPPDWRVRRRSWPAHPDCGCMSH